jgi:hypothetical protein
MNVRCSVVFSLPRVIPVAAYVFFASSFNISACLADVVLCAIFTLQFTIYNLHCRNCHLFEISSSHGGEYDVQRDDP